MPLSALSSSEDLNIITEALWAVTCSLAKSLIQPLHLTLDQKDSYDLTVNSIQVQGGMLYTPSSWCIMPPWYSKLWVTLSKDWEQAKRGAVSKVLVPTLLHLVWYISVAFSICHRKGFSCLGSARLHSFLHSFDVKSLATLLCPLLVIWIHFLPH